MDVDHLKRINDQYGHPVGDAVLAGVVRHLDLHLRTQDKVFRYGGDEFLVALSGADLPTAHEVISRVRLGLAGKLLIAGPDGYTTQVTASFGLALLDPDEDVERIDRSRRPGPAAGQDRRTKSSRGVGRIGNDRHPLAPGRRRRAVRIVPI